MNINKSIIYRSDSLLNKIIDRPKTQKYLAKLSNHKDKLPVILLEGTVIAGRCHQAKERGGSIEVRERFTEETLTSIIWLFGVAVLNKIGDFCNKAILKLDTAIDMGAEELPKGLDGLGEHIKDPFTRFTEGRSSKYKSILAGVKFTKIVLSSLAAVYIVGSIIPKFNQSLTRKTIEKKKQQANNQNNLSSNLPNNKSVSYPGKVYSSYNAIKNGSFRSMQNFLNTTRKHAVAFKGGTLDFFKMLGHNLENHNIYQLLTVDTGVSGGRAWHARNNDERREILLRDIGSIYFYMFSTPHIIKFLSNKFDNKYKINTKIDPKVAKQVNDSIYKGFGLSQNISLDKFGHFVVGQSRPEDQIQEFVQMAQDKGNKLDGIDLKEFVKKVDGIDLKKFIGDVGPVRLIDKYSNFNSQVVASDEIMQISNEIREMAKSKPMLDTAEQLKKLSCEMYEKIFSGKEFTLKEAKKRIESIAGLNLPETSGFKTKLSEILEKPKFIVTEQIPDILRGGLAGDPEFLWQAYSNTNPNVANPKKFVTQKEIGEMKTEIRTYLEKVYENVKGAAGNNTSINKVELEAILTGVKNKTSLMKMGYVATGLAVSAFFLSYAIPKIQYYITKKKTGQNSFPGIQGLETGQPANQQIEQNIFKKAS